MKKLRLIIDGFSEEVAKCHLSAYASSAAFFMFLSMIPMLLVICTIIPYTPITEADLMSALAQILPQNLVPIAISTVSDVYDKSPAILSLSAIVTVWSAGKGMLAIIRGLNAINEAYKPVNYFLQRIRASVYTVILVLMIFLLLIVGVFGESIAVTIGKKIPDLTILNPLLSRMKLLVLFVLLCLFFLLLFTYIPSKKIDWRTQIIGSFFVGVTWSLFSYAFSVYVRYFTGASVYGNMSTIIILMLWFYAGFYLMFLGALISKFFTPATEFLMKRFSNKKQNTIES